MSFKRLMVLGVLMGTSLQTLGSMRRMVPAGAKMGASALSATGFRNVSSGGNVPTMSLEQADIALGVKPGMSYWDVSREFINKFNEQPEDQEELVEAFGKVLERRAGDASKILEQWNLFFRFSIDDILGRGARGEDQTLAMKDPKAFAKDVSAQISRLDNMYKIVKGLHPDIHLYGVDISNCSPAVVRADNNSLIKSLVQQKLVSLPENLVKVINTGREDIFTFLMKDYKDKFKPDIQDLIAMFKTGRFEAYYKGMLDKAGIDYKKIILDFMTETRSLRVSSYAKWHNNGEIINDLYHVLILKCPKLAIELADNPSFIAGAQPEDSDLEGYYFNLHETCLTWSNENGTNKDLMNQLKEKTNQFILKNRAAKKAMQWDESLTGQATNKLSHTAKDLFEGAGKWSGRLFGSKSRYQEGDAGSQKSDAGSQEEDSRSWFGR
jgi:hypothetical protein